ncbi:MAG TPA: hypothetical protein VG053_08510 [Solirubrobacteraceae bacterium]|jgi:hypothetical protein|nr:hypothetical protein [Solirubrobacteraceae bacterium]
MKLLLVFSSLFIVLTISACGGSTTTVERTVVAQAPAVPKATPIAAIKVEPASFSSIKVSYVTSRPFGIEPGEQVGGFATCPSGQIAIGGGGYGSSANPAQNMDASEPRKGPGSSVPNQWAAWFNNGTGTPDSFIVYAVCISPAHASVTGSFVQH